MTESEEILSELKAYRTVEICAIYHKRPSERDMCKKEKGKRTKLCIPCTS